MAGKNERKPFFFRGVLFNPTFTQGEGRKLLKTGIFDGMKLPGVQAAIGVSLASVTLFIWSLS